jgi:hypothetical protein
MTDMCKEMTKSTLDCVDVVSSGWGGGGLLKEVDELTGSVRLNTELSPTRLPEAMVLAEV